MKISTSFRAPNPEGAPDTTLFLMSEFFNKIDGVFDIKIRLF
jgi:hypothetical protein